MLLADSFQKLVKNLITEWGKTDYIADQALVREMFDLLHRQYNGIGELASALETAYVISSASKADIAELLRCMGTVRGLLTVQVDEMEEELLKTNIWSVRHR